MHTQPAVPCAWDPRQQAWLWGQAGQVAHRLLEGVPAHTEALHFDHTGEPAVVDHTGVQLLHLVPCWRPLGVHWHSLPSFPEEVLRKLLRHHSSGHQRYLATLRGTRKLKMSKKGQ